MNTKHFPTFSFFIFFLLSILVSCSSEDPFVVCKVSEYDCDYQHQTPGIITITKGSSRKHYILTEKGMKRAEIKEGEPIAYNSETGTAVVKEVTDSSIDIFTVDTGNGKVLSPEISLKPKMTGKDGKPFFALPTLLSSCVQNDGTVILLINYEKPAFSGSKAASESYDLLYAYEKGDPKKLKKYIFPYDEDTEEDSEEKAGAYFWEEPKKIQCRGKNIYIFSERNYSGGEFFRYDPQPAWVLGRLDTALGGEETRIENIAFIAYDDVRFNHYSEKENTVYTDAHSSENEKETAELRILKLDKDGELPEEPLKKEDGHFLFSETPGGKHLTFYIKTRSRLEEQRLEPLFQ